MNFRTGKKVVLLVVGAVTFIANTARGGDLGFRFVAGRCVNTSGEAGLNPAYLGQCADLRGLVLGRVSLKGADLSGSTFEGADLQKVSFEDAILRQVDFSDANLSGSLFAGAHIESCRFLRARLKLVNFGNAVLSDARFDEADFDQADLSYLHDTGGTYMRARFVAARLGEASFRSANFSGARLDRSDLRASVFRDVRLDDVTIDSSDLGGTDFGGSRGRGLRLLRSLARAASFVGVDLIAADFRFSDLSGSDFSQARVVESDARSAVLSEARGFDAAELTGTRYNLQTLLPIARARAAEKGMLELRRPEPRVHWAFEGDGRDDVGDALPLTLVNAPTFVPGRHGQGLALNGQDQFARTEKNLRLADKNRWTLAVWVYPRQQESDQFGIGILGWGTSGRNQGTHFYYNPRDLNFESGFFDNDFETRPSYLPERWYHAVTTFDGRVHRIYLDGELAQERELVTFPDNGVFTVSVGRDPYDQGRNLRGVLDDAMIFDFPLNAEEVRDVYLNR